MRFGKYAGLVSVLSMAGTMLLFLFFAPYAEGQSADKKQIAPSQVEAARVASIRAAVADCHIDRQLCVGAYVKWKRGGKISRLGSCGICDTYRVHTKVLTLYTFEATLDRFEYVVLPKDRPRWDAAAVDYAMQFVQQK